MTITPTELTEIERKARAYQAEEAANPDAKTCQRPTPELVLRLVDACRELHSKVRLYEETVVVANGKLIAERADLRAKVAELRKIIESLSHFTEKYAGMAVQSNMPDEAHAAYALAEYAMAAQNGHSQPCTLGPLCPYCEIEGLRAKVAELEAAAPELLAVVKEYIITLTSTVEQWGERQEQHSEWTYLQELKALVARIEDAR